MKERPVLFSAPMVRAILECRKTQTRRVIKRQPANGKKLDGIANAREYLGPKHKNQYGAYFGWSFRPCQYGQPGDRLWVRETWDRMYRETPSPVVYRATYDGEPSHKWRPSIHMPRWASRITLEITSVRVERLQGISEDDAQSEGITTKGFLDDIAFCNPKNPIVDHPSARNAFIALWESINGAESWADNPWVWVIEFKRI